MKLIANATDTAARQELWLSFRSLLQAYLAAASMGEAVPRALVCDTGSGRVQLVGPVHTVELALEAATGEGYWVVHRAGTADSPEGTPLDEGNFRLHLDAQFEWSGKAGLLAMDQIAEALAMLVVE